MKKGNLFGNTALPLGPFANQISMAAIPLKSNITTYGPWYKAGVPGKVRFERDESLVPWNYGGFDVMNLAGNAKVTNAATNMQEAETGSVEIAGTPTRQLGAVLQANGPTVTSLQVNIGREGVTTSMGMQTFTPLFGNFSKGNIERFRRLGVTGQNRRRTLRELIRAKAPNSLTNIQKQQREQKLFAQAGAARNKNQMSSPATAIAAYVGDDHLADSTQRIGVSFLPIHDAVAGCMAGQDDYARVAFAQLSTIFRPFAMAESSYMPYFQHDDMSNAGTREPKSALTANDLNPFQEDHDMEIVSRGTGSEYEEANTRLVETFDYSKHKGIAFKGPPVMAGWGFTSIGKPVPASESGGREFADNFLRNSAAHKVGPIDFRWDENRQVWNGWSGILLVKFKEDLTAGGTAEAYVESGADADEDKEVIEVNNPLGQGILEGQKAMVAYDAEAGQFYPIQAEFTRITLVTNIDCAGRNAEVCSRKVYLQGDVQAEEFEDAGCTEPA